MADDRRRGADVAPDLRPAAVPSRIDAPSQICIYLGMPDGR